MNVGESTVDKWVRQLKDERNGITPQGTALTPDQQKIKDWSGYTILDPANTFTRDSPLC